MLVGDDKSDASFRVYVGHAGGGPGQLDAELARGDWLVRPADTDSVFFDIERLWQQLQPPDPAWTAELRFSRSVCWAALLDLGHGDRPAARIPLQHSQ